MMQAHSQRAHARLAPSAAHRWMNCAGSIAASEGIPNTSSVFADEGTAAHTLADVCLRRGLDAKEYLGVSVDLDSGLICTAPPGPRVFEVTVEMVEAVQLYLDLVRDAMIEEHGGLSALWIEQKFDLTFVPGMDGGTGDAVIYNHHLGELHVIDLKYGRGVPVEAQGNPQLMLYAIGALRMGHEYVETVRVTIVQPRCPHPDGPVRTAVYGRQEMTDFTIEVAHAARAALRKDAPRTAGEWCKFCPVGLCDVLRKESMALAVEIFGEIVPEPDELSPARLAEILTKVGILRVWVKRVEEYANKEAHAGRSPPGFKLVAKRAMRKWQDEAEAATAMLGVGANKDDIYETSLISPAQADKLLGKKNKGVIEPFVVKESSGTILVHDSDPRPTAKLSASETFSIEYGEE